MIVIMDGQRNAVKLMQRMNGELDKGYLKKSANEKFSQLVDKFLVELTEIHEKTNKSNIHEKGANERKSSIYSMITVNAFKEEMDNTKVLTAFDTKTKEMIGFIVAYFDEEEQGYINGLFVEESYRRQTYKELKGRSIASYMYEEAEDWLAKNTFTEIELTVLPGNERGKKFWSSQGFELVDDSDELTFLKLPQKLAEKRMTGQFEIDDRLF